MPEFGFPAQPRNNSMTRLIAGLRDRSDDERVAAVTGRFADVTSQLQGRVSELMQIEKSITDLQQYGDAIALSEARASTLQSALDQINSIGVSLNTTTDLLQTNGSDLDFEIVSAQARSELGSIVAALNVNLGGRTLFAGDISGSAAIADDTTVFNASVPFLEGATSAVSAYTALEAEFVNSVGLYATSFYLGGAGDAPATEVAPGERVAYGVKADEEPIRRVLFNTVVLAAAYDRSNAIPTDQRRELVELASGGLRNATAGMSGLQGRLGISEARIATIKSRNIAADAALSISFNEIAGADQFGAALNLSDLENQLEVAFATTARLANLTLANVR